MRLKLTIAYDGAPFAGWQSQPNAETIQDLIEAAIAVTAKEKVRLHGSGRTDAGVHALGQVAHFDSPDHLTMNPFNWVPALNTKLPAAIRILSCDEVAPDFHSRFQAVEKTYTYHLCTLPILPPFLAGRAWHLPRLLNPEDLTEALGMFQGTHDFRAFAANRGNETEETDYSRTITEASFQHTHDGFLIRFTGNGFLYKMVRLLTGAAVNSAQGYLRLDDLYQLVEKPADTKSPLCAPADGLTLLEVNY
ncbi:MAG: tRNA pseudouridine(38-40) synthase TruA [Verrucomicrobiaceae bacterium]